MPEPAYSEQFLPGGNGGRGDRTLPAAPPLAATFNVASDDDRLSVTVHTTLSRDADQDLPSVLRQALSISVGRIDLDLSEVKSCDAFGLHLLLDMRRRALEQGKALTVRASSPAVDQRLDLTGTRTLFAPPPPDDANAPHHAGQGTDPDHDTDQQLHAANLQLRRAIQTRPVIDLARGILMASFGLTAEGSWEALVTTSQNTNTKLHRLAEDLVDAVHGPALPKAVQEQLAAAAAKAPAEPTPPPARPSTSIPQSTAPEASGHR